MKKVFKAFLLLCMLMANISFVSAENDTSTTVGPEVEGDPIYDDEKLDPEVNQPSAYSIGGDYNKPVQMPMYRIYNPNSGEHFYTSSEEEKAYLIKVGWNDEGLGWTAISTSSKPVYRLYNSIGGEHHYTLSEAERDNLVNVGWKYEGIGWYSDGEIPLYRVYNPNAFANNHHYTTSVEERDYLLSIGWRDEGIGWYGVNPHRKMEGIDISEHNGDMDLEPYENGFVIIRAGWGTNTDTEFLKNVKKCEELNIPYGVYFYSYAINTEEAKTEAEYFVELLKQCKPSVGVWLDMEDADGYKRKTTNYEFMEGSLISDICQTFCKIVSDAGYHTGIYASTSWFENHIKGCEQYDVWEANWGINDGSFNDRYDKGGSLHQYTSKPLDKDVMYVDLETFLQ